MTDNLNINTSSIMDMQKNESSVMIHIEEIIEDSSAMRQTSD